MSPVIPYLPGHHASKRGGKDHMEDKDGVEGSVPTEVVRSHNNTVASSWL